MATNKKTTATKKNTRAKPASGSAKKAPVKKKSVPAKKVTAKKSAPKAAKKAVKAAPKAAKKAVKAAPKAAKKVVKAAPKAAKKVVKAAPKAAKKPVSTSKSKKKAVVSATPKRPIKPVKSKKQVLPPPRSLPPVRPLELKPHGKSKRIKQLSAKEIAGYRQALLNMRDQVVDGITFLSGDNLNRSQRDASGDLSGYSLHMADQGTDNYDREFALNLVSSEQDMLYEIDEAIRRIDAGTYGICELTGEPIERARLNVLPYARLSVLAQSEVERGKKRYRPFGPTLSH
jgi:DnaK suppressor protein